MANVLTSFLIPDYLLDELKVVAEKNCLSVSAQLRTLIVNYLKEQKESQSNWYKTLDELLKMLYNIKGDYG